MARLTYIANFHSVASYAILFWGSSSEAQRVLLLQKRAIRALFGLGPRDSCREAFRAWGILTVPKGNSANFMKEVNNAGTFISLMIYANIIVFRRRTILKLLFKLDEEEYQYNEEYKPVKIYIEKLSKLYFYPTRYGLLFWFLDRVIWNLRCIAEKNESHKRIITCANSLSNWMPSSIDSALLDWSILASSIYAVYYMPYVITVSSIHIGCTYVSVARLQRLIRMLGGIDFSGNNVVLTRRKLLQCIDFYNETNEITNLVTNYVKEKLNPLLSYSVMVLVAVLIHQITVDFNIILFLELWVWILSHSLISFHAQDLENMATMRSTASNTSIWREGSTMKELAE
ncbi:uncharacterized protein LOC123306816 [Coccinella septempunctata]|uniref:uncharacterized protein LOC123306816 n=1 Tax=Coccinella septempunctata TaxID=41139 RepID=UPI001D092EA8|nr:uncharacterized protein LOC123306816 [Coccinella septempunctata]